MESNSEVQASTAAASLLLLQKNVALVVELVLKLKGKKALKRNDLVICCLHLDAVSIFAVFAVIEP